ncbi:uncharacterized protein LOC106014231 [Aplysia californica]|uniref:Uncharacterized protein LOC106014231 n=1 Tax=Aplysia californica TaxID=6500 RepID=A0ABM1AG32_APLCA|nr:uncharacterized protein LOC106014231 [Aplysia californica]
MECQIVPTAKIERLKIKKHREAKEKALNQNCVCDGDCHRIYSSMPTFKAPKSTFPDKEKDSEGKNIKSQIQNSNKYNHFTMSRPGLNGSPLLSQSPAICDSAEISTDPNNKDQATTDTNRKIKTGTVSYQLKCNGSTVPETTLKSNPKHGSERRRASDGDEMVDANRSRTGARKSVVQISDNLPTLSKSPVREATGSHTVSPRQGSARNRLQERRKSSPVKYGAENPFLGVAESSALRRKSMNDSRGVSPWYYIDSRPVSSDTHGRPHRRNVISPTTLHRLSTEAETERGGSAALSFCTEDDWKLYGSNFPNRRLVSHRKLNHECSLPYSDNIGLEETVTSDQAKKASKQKHHRQTPKKPANTRTPKQLWYRTIRSILAANYLYHQVQKKKKHVQ